MLALDTETALIEPGLQVPPLVVVSVSGGDWAQLLVDRGRIVNLLEGGIVGLNIAFDLAVIANEYDALDPVFDAYDADRITDIAVRQKLIDIAAGTLGWMVVDGKRQRNTYSLADLTRLHFGIELDKSNPWRMRYAELRGVPLDDWPVEAVQYAEDDARATYAIWEAQEASSHLLTDQYRQARADLWLKLTSAWGLTTDPARVEAFASRAQERYDRLAAELVAAGLKRADRATRAGKYVEGARDTKAAGARLEAAYAALSKPCPRTPTGQPQLTEETCKASGDPLLTAYGEFASASHVLSTEVPLVRRGLIHARFDSLVATGRTASSPNVQNLPTVPGMRECFIPRPGMVYVACDYSGFELATWSQVCIDLFGRSKMAEAINADLDPHCIVAAEILNVSYDEAVAQKKTAEGYAARQCGKACNFGLPGGMGAARFVIAAANYGVQLTEYRAEQLKRLWKATWPEASEYLAYVGRVSEQGVAIEQCRSGRVRGGLTFTSCANGYFQSLAADAAKAAGWLICKACYNDRDSVLFGSRIVNFIHDEFLLESPEELGHECAEELARLMVTGAQPWVPDVRLGTESVLTTSWQKQARPVWQAGRLVPWHAP